MKIIKSSSPNMAITLEEIRRPISVELNAFEGKFRKSMESKVSLLDKIMYYIVQRKGKQIRPMFVFLVANLVGETTEKTYRAASFIELLHTGTLVHDDVVDDSNERRGFFSINALWKNKIAVLVGDFLFAKGFLIAIENEDIDLVYIISKAIKDMSEGELLQIEKARRLDITEDVYYDIITKKTASLMASACGTGMASVTDDKALIEKAKLLGETMGIAFQIKDDLFDFSTGDTGKPKGIDIKEQKMTLPLIYALQQVGWLERKRIINIIRFKHKNKKSVAKVVEFIKANGGVDYANKAMQTYVDKAKLILDGFDDSPHKKSLDQLIEFIITRNK